MESILRLRRTHYPQPYLSEMYTKGYQGWSTTPIDPNLEIAVAGCGGAIIGLSFKADTLPACLFVWSNHQTASIGVASGGQHRPTMELRVYRQQV